MKRNDIKFNAKNLQYCFGLPHLLNKLSRKLPIRRSGYSHNFSSSAINNNQFNNVNKNAPQNSNNSSYNIIKQTLLNVISGIFIILVVYRFIIGLTVVGLYVVIISFIISFLFSSFISNNFKYSNNIIVRVLQKVVIFFFLLLFFWFWLFYL